MSAQHANRFARGVRKRKPFSRIYSAIFFAPIDRLHARHIGTRLSIFALPPLLSGILWPASKSNGVTSRNAHTGHNSRPLSPNHVCHNCSRVAAGIGLRACFAFLLMNMRDYILHAARLNDARKNASCASPTPRRARCNR